MRPMAPAFRRDMIITLVNALAFWLALIANRSRLLQRELQRPIGNHFRRRGAKKR